MLVLHTLPAVVKSKGLLVKAFTPDQLYVATCNAFDNAPDPKIGTCEQPVKSFQYVLLTLKVLYLLYNLIKIFKSFALSKYTNQFYQFGA